jgi:hypothetical protein
MFSFLKYVKLLGLFKDAVTAYKEETGEDKVPKILHRRVFGAIILLIGTTIGIYFGIESDIWAGNINAIVDNLDKLVSAVIALYGIVQIIIGIFGARRRDA